MKLPVVQCSVMLWPQLQRRERIDVLLVTAPDQDAVRDYADEQGIKTTHAIQQEQLGTGDAVRAAFEAQISMTALL